VEHLKLLSGRAVEDEPFVIDLVDLGERLALELRKDRISHFTSPLSTMFV